MNLISSIVTVVNAFCPPRAVSCSLSDVIDDFIFMGEVSTQIYNLATGCSANAYDNRTGQSVSLVPNTAYTLLVSTLYSLSEQISIWIDFDDNSVFAPSEQVATRALNSTYDTPVIITIAPIGSVTKTGMHRMRATLAYSSTPDPCSPTNTYGETHDYSVNILNYTRKSPDL